MLGALQAACAALRMINTCYKVTEAVGAPSEVPRGVRESDAALMQQATQWAELLLPTACNRSSVCAGLGHAAHRGPSERQLPQAALPGRVPK